MVEGQKRRQILEEIRAGKLSARDGMIALQQLGQAPLSVVDTHMDEDTPEDAIAIVGMACRFPDAEDIDSFWKNLTAGRDSIRDQFPCMGRVQNDFSGEVPEPAFGGYLDGIDAFDPQFFGLSPAEAKAMDPQQRLCLQTAWHAIEDAGMISTNVAGSLFSVYIGARESDYRDLLSLDEVNSYSLGGNSLAVLAARISYLLDLKGANMPVTTGCSSSLVALHQACESIRSGHASIAMAGGVSVMCTPGLHKVLKRAGMLSPLGRCHAFDEQADGFVPAEGVGMLVLKSLKQARADQDRVHAVILGSGINYDGRSNGITAPSGSSQVELMERVYKDYAIDRDTIHYVETHGTGTVLGDPIEVGGLREIFVKNTGSVAIGSVKSNIGHALEAAGVAGVIKTVLSLKNAQLPPSLHFKSANRHIDFGMNGLRVNDHLTDWEAPSRGRRRASVSAFGFSGTNAHVVLEEFIHKKTGRHDDGQAWPVVLSSKDEAGLKRRLEQMADWLVGSGGTLPLERLAYTLSCRRDIFTRRFVVWVRNISELQECIDGVLNCGSSWRQDGLDPAQEQKSDDFLNGAEVSFEDLFAGTSSAQPLSLPGYPFSKESCWILEEDKVVQPDTIRLEAGHPLIRDHRYDGRCLLPAVGYLDALLSAARRGGLSLPLRFNQVFWLRPCFVDGAFSDLRIRETNSKGGLRQELSSIDTSGELLVHLKSNCQPLEAAAPEVGPVDFDFLEGVEIDAALVYQRFEKLGLGLGPALQTVRRVKVAGDVVWAELETGDSTAWQDPNFLEPALLDGALQSFMATVSDEAASFYAPFGVRRVDFFRPLIGGGISKLMPQLTSQRGNEQIVLNLEIYDRLGLLAIRMEGFESRRFEKEIPLPEHSWFAAEWVSRHLDEMKDVAAEPIHWIGRDGLSYDEALQKTWSAESGRLQAIVELDVLAGDKEVRPDQLTHRLSKWIHHFCAGNAVADKSIVVVANGTEQHGWAGGLRALLATASQEYENFRGHVYCCDDLSNTKRGPSSGERSVVSQLIRSNEPCGHWRTVSGGLQRQNWGVIEPTVFELKPGGVYLITGGMGAMGLELARSLCSQRNGQVILVGRAEANAAIQEALDTLNQERKCASYFSVNLSDAAAVQRLADWTKEQYPHLDGVFHAAGVTQDGLMGEKDAAAFAATWEPKVEGLSTLNQSGLFADRPFLFLFSSLSAVFGNRGQADYAFANACLNEWSARFDSKAVDAAWSRVVSVAWPYVEEGGMQVDVLRIERMAAKTGMKAMPLRCVLPMVEAALSLEAPVLALSFGERARCQKLFEGSFSELSAHEVPVEVAVISHEVAYALLVDAVSTVLQLDQSKLTAEAPLSEYGFDSVNLTDLSEYLDAEHGMLIQPSTFFEYQNLGKLAELVATMLPVKVEVPPAIEKVISTPERKIGIKVEADIDEGVAIIGMSGRFPGSPDLDHFWKHLCAGENLISEVPADRWRSEDLRKLFAPEEMKHFDSVRWGGFIEDSDAFDADFFGISPREAALMDPQQRLFLESVWHAIEDAGYQPGDLSGTRTGVFAGVSSTDYHQLLLKQSDNVEPYQSTGMAHSVLTNRVSYLLNLKGPSRPFDTACSSSLIALHEAVESIRRGECDTALAGGVSLMFSPMVYLAFAKAGMLAPDGRCKAFDEAADGYVRGEGVGVVLLKSLSAARRDGDSIYAVVRGSSENHGGHTPSLTAPNPIAQAELIEQAWARAGCRPEGLGLIEAHGTGTRLGDPIECNALRRVHQSIGFDPDRPVALGSLKANVGHLEAAAGIASVIKAALCLKYRKIVRQNHFSVQNPQIDLKGTPYFIPTETINWQRPMVGAEAVPRRAGVSSFGFGGSYAHALLEEEPELISTPIGQEVIQIVPLSAKTQPQLLQVVRSLLDSLKLDEAISLRDITGTLSHGRTHYEVRLAIVAETVMGVIESLQDWLDGDQREAAVCRISGSESLRVRALEWARKSGALPVEESSFQRVHLPGYPFVRTRHWALKDWTSQVVGTPVEMPGFVKEPYHENPNSGESLMDAVEALFADWVSELAGVPLTEVDSDVEFGQMGFDSLLITRFCLRLELYLESVPKTLIYEYPTIGLLANYLVSAFPEGCASACKMPTNGSADLDLKAEVAPIVKIAPTGIAEDERFAVIGMAGRFPGAGDLDELWQLLSDGLDSRREVPAFRWDWREFMDSDGKREPGSIYCKWGCFLDDVDAFDTEFFKISPREAIAMDPQERIFLETAWHAIEDSGYSLDTLKRKYPKGTGADIGTFVGVTSQTYSHRSVDASRKGVLPQSLEWSVANRLSYIFDFQGPSMPVDTACSASLSAVHQACESLRRGECRIALVGGVNLYLHESRYQALCEMEMLSQKGYCHSFGEEADGFLPGEGVAAIVLKPLSEAVNDGDRIHGVISGTGISHSGKTAGYTVPGPVAVGELVSSTLARAGIDFSTLGYIEAHGTGTSLGDPIEIRALRRAADQSSETLDAQACAIGSIKSNIGHLESAAGLAGIIKVLLQLRHRRLAPSLHAGKVNPEITFEASPFRLQTRLESWASTSDGSPRRAGVVSMGAGGANAFAVLEEYCVPSEVGVRQLIDKGGPELILLSATSVAQLQVVVGNFLEFVETRRRADTSEGFLRALAKTLRVGRQSLKVRIALAADNLDGLVEILRKLGPSEKIETKFYGETWGHPHGSLITEWLSGKTIQWAEYFEQDGNASCPRVDLPPYPFDRQHYWTDSSKEGAVDEVDLLLGSVEWMSYSVESVVKFPYVGEQVGLVCLDGQVLSVAEQEDLSRSLGCPIKLIDFENDVWEREACVVYIDYVLPLETTSPSELSYTRLRCLLKLEQAWPQQAIRWITLSIDPTAEQSESRLAGLAGLYASLRLEREFIDATQLHMTAASAGDTDAWSCGLSHALAAKEYALEYSAVDCQCRVLRAVEPEDGSMTFAPWIDQGDVILITGAMGALGQKVALHCAAQVRVQLILTGRRPADTAVNNFLQRLKFLGSDAEYVVCDVADRATVDSLVMYLRHRYGRIDGIIHSAGVIQDALAENKTVAGWQSVLAAKIDGARALDEATAGQSLKYYIFFSSLAGWTGRPGQTDYAYANAYLDSFSRERNQRVRKGERQGHTLSINWPHWAEGGMVIEEADRELLRKRYGIASLTDEAGLEALDRAMSLRSSQCLVAYGEVERLKSLLRFAERELDVKEPISIPAQPDLNKEKILKQVSAIICEELMMEEDSIMPDIDIGSLGLNSISVASIMRSISDVFPVEFSITDLFACEDVQSVVDMIIELSGETLEEVPEGVRDSRSRKLTETQSNLFREWLSDDQSSKLNLPMVFKLSAGIDQDGLKAVIREIWSQYSIVRSCINYEGEVFSLIETNRELVIEEIDGTEVSPLVSLDALARRSFDLLEGPLFRATLYRAVTGEEYLLLCMHHIIADGQTLWIIADMLQSGELVSQEKNSFGAYAAWLESWMASPAAAKQHTYWIKQFAHWTDTCVLPIDHEPSADSMGNTMILSREISREVLEQLDRRVSESRCSRASIMAAAVGQVVSSFSAKDCSVLALPVDTRPLSGFNETLGPCLNVVPLYLPQTGSMDRDSVLKETHRLMLQAFENGMYPCLHVDHIGKHLQPELTIAFNYIKEPRGSSSDRWHEFGDGLDSIRQLGEYPVVFEFGDQGSALTYAIKYDVTRYTEAHAQAWLELLVEEIESLVSDASTSVPQDLVVPDLQDTAQLVGEVLGRRITAVDYDRSLGDLGFDSVKFTTLSLYILKSRKRRVRANLFYQYDSIRKLALLLDSGTEKISVRATSEKLAAEEAPAIKSHAEVKGLPVPPRTREVDSNKIAVIAMAGRLPGCSNLEEFAQQLFEGHDFVGSLPLERWTNTGIDCEALTNAQGSFLDSMAEFDAEYFEISASAAAQMDPRQRLFLEVATETFQLAGYTREALKGTRTGVFVGATGNEFADLLGGMGFKPDSHTFPGVASTILANRVSHVFDLKGPSAVVDTACSSSLVAIHRAVRSLQSGECSMALAGGVNLVLNPYSHEALQETGMMSPSGHCHTFGAAADGYVRGECVGAVLLKPLAEAQRDGDAIQGVIMSSVENHGGHANTLTSPNVSAQADLIEEAVERAGIRIDALGLVETHGTGTKLGDPAEVSGLKNAFDRLADKQGIRFEDGRCALGSLKANVGHLEAAAGIASLFKVLLSMKHERLVPNIHHRPVNPELELAAPFTLIDQAENWEPRMDRVSGIPGMWAGISSFGFGGNNAHLIVEAAPEDEGLVEDDLGTNVFILSARNLPQLKNYAEAVVGALVGQKALRLANVCHTYRVGRDSEPYRFSCIVSSLVELIEKLRGVATGSLDQAIQPVATIPDFNVFDGPSGDTYLQALIESGDLSKLIELWQAGQTIPWKQVGELFAKGRILPLPVCPLVGKCFWLNELDAERFVRKPAIVHQVRGDESEASQLAVDPGLGEKLLGIVSDVIGLSPEAIDWQTNLKVYGFDSLSGMTAVSQINEAFEIQISFQDLYQCATLAEVRQLLELQGAETPTVQATVPVRSESESLDRLTSILSDNQEALWAAHRLDPDNYGYNAPVAFVLNGKIDADLWSEACRRTFDSIQELRIVLQEDAEGLVDQRVYDGLEADVRIVSAVPGEDFEACLKRDCRLPFDLYAGPLCRFRLYERGDESSVFSFVMHHILCDGRSISAVVAEVLRSYQMLRSGKDLVACSTTLPSFFEFIEWQKQWLITPAAETTKAYWLERLQGLSDIPTLPFAKIAEPGARFQGESVFMSVSVDLMARIRRLGVEQNVTPFVVLLSAFYSLLSRFNGSEKQALVTPFHGRTKSSFSDSVGYFLNMVPLLGDVREDLSFSALLQSVHQSVGEAMQHGDYPFARLSREFGKQSGRPLSEVIRNGFYYHNTDRDQIRQEGEGILDQQIRQEGEGILDQQISSIHQEGEFELVMDCIQVGDTLNLFLKYETAIYDQAAVEDFLERYLVLIESVTKNPELPIFEYRLLSEAEEQAMIFERNRTEVALPDPALLHSLISARAQERAAAPAVHFKGNHVSYTQLDEQSNQVAQVLHKAGVGSGDFVGVFMPRSAEMLTGMLGILKAGAAYLPIDAKYPDERISYMLKNAGAQVVLTADTTVGHSALSDCQNLRLIDCFSSENSVTPVPDLTLSPEDPAYIIYTSGSTGKPKGVVIPHKAVVNFLLSMAKEPGLTADDRMLALTTICFDISVLELFLPLIVGAQVEILSENDIIDGISLAEKLESGWPTVVQATPASWEMLLAAEWQGGQPLKVLCGGETLSKELAAKLFARCDELWNMYGPTETTVWSLVERVIDPEIITIGRPIDNTQCYILDDRGRLCPDGLSGELFLGGDGLALGYHRREDLTQSKFVDDPFRPGMRIYSTGDEVCYRPDGSLLCLGRLDQQVKLRGHRIELGEIESVLLQVTGVEGAVVALRNAGTVDSQLVGFLKIGADFVGKDNFSLRDMIETWLPSYMIPSHFYYVDAYPMTLNRKVDRKTLGQVRIEDLETSVGLRACGKSSELAAFDISLDHPEIRALEPGAIKTPSADFLAELSEGYVALNRHCMGCLARAWLDAGITSSESAAFFHVPKYSDLVEICLQFLEDDGYLKTTEIGWQLLLESVPDTAALSHAETALEARYAFVRPNLILLSRCLADFVEIIAGRKSSIEAMFPGGSMELVEGLYRGSVVVDYFNHCVGEQIAQRVGALQAEERIITILEVGAGTGATSRVVFERLRSMNCRVRYYYTDVSKAIIQKAKQVFSDAKLDVEYRVLDLEVPFGQQGFEAASVDILFGSNVVHATSDIAKVLGHLRGLLRPGGVILLNELTKLHLFSTLTFGLTDGWWLFADKSIRIRGGPLLSLASWKHQLERAGFESVVAYSFPSASIDDVAQAVVVGEVAATSDADVEQDRNQDSNASSLQNEIVNLVAELVQVSPAKIDVNRHLGEIGIDSIKFTVLSVRLSKCLQVDVKPTLFYQYSKISSLVSYLKDEKGVCVSAPQTPVGKSASAVTIPAVPELETSTPNTVAQPHADSAAPVAIVGYAGSLPGGDSLDSFWKQLEDCEDCVTNVPADRWDEDLLAFGGERLKNLPLLGGFISGYKAFDAAYFGVSRREAELMDPRQRLFLQSVLGAVEHAGYALSSIEGSDTGVFVGIAGSEYADLQSFCDAEVDGYLLSGLAPTVIANRVSYLLDLHGPSAVIDTACSSSLVAVHRAVSSLRRGESKTALAGGVNVILNPFIYAALQKNGMLSPDGRCKTFDATANGYGRGEGVGVVYLKLLKDAERDGDTIHAVIRGSGESHGGRTNSLTAPNIEAQAELIVRAQQEAGFAPETIGYWEAHGTGTPLGDPVEIKAVTEAFRRLKPGGKVSCAIGSVKANIGHLEAAAGIAGLLKTLLCLKHGRLPGNPHLHTVNPHIEGDGVDFHLLKETVDWQRLEDTSGRSLPRRAGISSFGFGGNYAHVALEEFIEPKHAEPEASPEGELIVLSAKNRECLQAYARSMAKYLSTNEPASLPSIAVTLRQGRDAMKYRFATVVRSHEELAAGLEGFLSGEQDGVFSGIVDTSELAMWEGPEGKAFLMNLVETHAWSKLASVWVQGCPYSWSELEGDRSVKRVPLPTYPFADTEYLCEFNWKRSGVLQSGTPSAAIGYGLIIKNELSLGGLRSTLRVTQEDWFIRDHQVSGESIMPGVVSIEWIQQAMTQAFPVDKIAIGDHNWVQPVIVPSEGKILSLLVETGSGLGRYRIVSDEGGREVLYAQGNLKVLDASSLASDAWPVAPSLDALDEVFDQNSEGEAYYLEAARNGFNYGSSLQSLQNVYWKRGESVGVLKIDSTAAKEFCFHPALLDGCLQVAGILYKVSGSREQAGAFPFTFRELVSFHPLSARSYVRVVIEDPQSETAAMSQNMDLYVYNEHSELTAYCRGYRLRKAAVAARVQHFAPVWVAPEPAEGNAAWKHVFRVGEFPPQGVETLTVETVFDTLVATEGSVSILDFELWSTEATAASVAARYFEYFKKLFKEHPKRRIRWVTVVRLQSGEVLNSRDQAYASMLLSLAREYPSFLAQIIAFPEAATADKMLHVLRATSAVQPSGIYAVFEGGLLRRGLTPLEPAGGEERIRAGGVYLITGGSGALAQKLAGWLRTEYQAIPVLLSRRASNDPEVYQADLGDRASLEGTIEKIKQGHGPLRGVFHLAGLVQDNRLAEKSWEEFEQTIRPKVMGLDHLDSVLADEALDCFVVFSSVAAIEGNAGQCDYAFGNGYLDGFVEAREALRRSGKRQGVARSINWPLWKDGGMQIDAANLRFLRNQHGFYPLETGEGLEALAEALNGEEVRTIVYKSSPKPEPVKTAATRGEDFVKPAPRVVHPDDVLEHLIPIVMAVLKSEADEIDHDEAFNAYGFDSISLTEFANALNDQYDLSLTPAVFFEHECLNQLADWLAEAHGSAFPIREDRPGPVEQLPELSPEVPEPPLMDACESQNEPIAIVGLAGTLPGSKDVHEFWENLMAEQSLIQEIPKDRWDWREHFGDPLLEVNKTQVKWGGFMEDVDQFDHDFFGISYREAQLMDPQQRLFLQETWKALELAGYPDGSGRDEDWCLCGRCWFRLHRPVKG